jgi:hypothetical protein
MFIIIYRLADPTTKIETEFAVLLILFPPQRTGYVYIQVIIIFCLPLLFEDQNPAVNNEENRNAILLPQREEEHTKSIEENIENK